MSKVNEGHLTPVQMALLEMCENWHGFDYGWTDYIEANELILMNLILNNKETEK